MDIGMSKTQKRPAKVSGEIELTYREHFSVRVFTVVDNTDYHHRQQHQRISLTIYPLLVLRKKSPLFTSDIAFLLFVLANFRISHLFVIFCLSFMTSLKYYMSILYTTYLPNFIIIIFITIKFDLIDLSTETKTSIRVSALK